MSKDRLSPTGKSQQESPDLAVSGMFDSFFRRERMFKDVLADLIRVRASGGTAPLRDEEGGAFNDLFIEEENFGEKERNESYVSVAAKMLERGRTLFEDPNEYNFFLNFYRDAAARVLEAPGAINGKLMESLLLGTVRAIGKERDPKSISYLLDTAHRIVLAEGEIAHGRSSYTFTRFLLRLEKDLGNSLEALLPDLEKNISGEVERHAAELYSDLLLQTWPKKVGPFYQLCQTVNRALALDESIEQMSDDARAVLANIEEKLLAELSRAPGIADHLPFWKEIADGTWGDYREIKALKALYSVDPRLAFSYAGRIIDEADADDLRETRARIIYWLRKEDQSGLLADSIAALGENRAQEFLALARKAMFYEDGFKIFPRDLELLDGLALLIGTRLR